MEPKNGVSVCTRNALHNIQIGPAGAAAMEPTTTIKSFNLAKQRFGKELALKSCTGKEWTWNQYYADIVRAAKSLIALKFEQFGATNVVGFNSPQWAIAYFASMFAGGFSAGVYTTNSSESCKFVATHSEASVVFVENEKQLEKYISKLSGLPKLTTLVVWNPTDKSIFDETHAIPVYSWDQFMELGEEVMDDVLENRMSSQQPGHCCTVVYTSGTTGNPKGVMLSHDAMSWTLRSSITRMAKLVKWGRTAEGERHVSFLPLSHIAGQLLDLHAPVTLAAFFKKNHTVYFAKPDALKGSLKDTLQEVRPTGFFAVPRVFEKFFEAIYTKGKSSKGLKKKISAWARNKGSIKFENSQIGGSKKIPSFYGVAEKLVFSKVKSLLGLNKAKFLWSGAAPLSVEVQRFMGSIGVTVTSGYGMSETCSVMTFGLPGGFKIGSPGTAVPGTDVIILDPDENGEGEIACKGRNVTMGYLSDPIKTDETIDSEGFLHTGDVGKFDSDGYLFITGRKKDLIITAGGENIAPVPIENYIKSKATMVSRAVLIGDRKKYLTILLTLNTLPHKEIDGKFTDILSPSGKVVPGVKTIADAKKSEAYMQIIQDAIDTYNTSEFCVSNAQKIQYFTVMDEEFEPVGECPILTPTQKVKRNIVEKVFQSEIEAMYSGSFSSLKQQ